MVKKKNKEEIPVKVDSVPSEGLEVDKSTSMGFVDNLIETFKDKGALLEAKRILDSKDKSAELDLILNDEEHTPEYQIFQQLKGKIK